MNELVKDIIRGKKIYLHAAKKIYYVQNCGFISIKNTIP